MDITAKMNTIFEEAKKLLPVDVQNDKDGATIPIEDFRKFDQRVRELVKDSVPWWAKI